MAKRQMTTYRSQHECKSVRAKQARRAYLHANAAVQIDEAGEAAALPFWQVDA